MRLQIDLISDGPTPHVPVAQIVYNDKDGRQMRRWPKSNHIETRLDPASRDWVRRSASMVGPSRWNSDRRLVGFHSDLRLVGFPRLDIQMTRDIRATRDSLGLSTGGLAKLVGVGRRTAERWMAGTSDVPEPVWRLLAACRDPAVRAIIEAIAQLADRIPEIEQFIEDFRWCDANGNAYDPGPLPPMPGRPRLVAAPPVDPVGV